MRFVDGLQHDIKSVVLLQRPKDLDTAATLALLQEEVAGGATRHAGRSGDWSSSAHFLGAASAAFAVAASFAPRQDSAGYHTG